ncbi:hypothetical protein BaRGS_00012567 [Batillaria attramentaria]|uniref:Apple domain-containing protein n=1 Tax=Batillaria attramentaria TaxID=370345 RepID=A0ABD0L9I7_9CAEN
MARKEQSGTQVLGAVMTLLVTTFPSTVWAATVDGSIKHVAYSRCPRGFTSSGQQLHGVVAARSRLDCFARCSLTTGCEAVNVCATESSPRRYRCVLLGDRVSGFCRGLVSAATPTCFFAQKVNFFL